MSRQYASLIGPLLGVYYPLPFADEGKNRVALQTSRLKHLWCSVYTLEETQKQISEMGGIMLDESFVDKLDFNPHEVFFGSKI